MPGSGSGKFIASAQSPRQRELLSAHPSSKPIIVDGEHNVYLRKVCQKVFFLKSDPEKEITSEDADHYKDLEEEDLDGTVHKDYRMIIPLRRYSA
jgi:hypothetical protein